MLLTTANPCKIIIKLIISLFFVFLTFNSFSKTKKNTNNTSNLIKIHSEKNSSFPLPNMDGIEEYFYNHHNSLPQTWGKENVNLDTYKNLALKQIGTQIVCTKIEGCDGFAYVYRKFYENNAYSTVTLDFINNSESTHHPITFIEMDMPLINAITYQYTDGKFYTKPIETLDYWNSLSGLDYYFYYKANKGEVITYLPFNYVPGITGNAFIESYNEDILSESIPINLTDPKGKEETIEYSTKWVLKGFDQIYPNISFNRIFQIPHGITQSDNYSWGFQLGSDQLSSIPFSNFKLSESISYTSTEQISVNDSTLISENITFPTNNYPAIGAIYSLYVVSKTSAPRLENLMQTINQKIKQKETNQYFRWELVKSSSSIKEDFDNMIDAKSSNSPIYINSFILIKIK